MLPWFLLERLCTTSQESSGAIFSEFHSPKDIYLLSIQAIYYIKFAENWHELTKKLMKPYEAHNCQRTWVMVSWQLPVTVLTLVRWTLEMCQNFPEWLYSLPTKYNGKILRFSCYILWKWGQSKNFSNFRLDLEWGVEMKPAPVKLAHFWIYLPKT